MLCNAELTEVYRLSTCVIAASFSFQVQHSGYNGYKLSLVAQPASPAQAEDASALKCHHAIVVVAAVALPSLQVWRVLRFAVFVIFA